MQIDIKKLQVLSILSQNLNNPNPQLVNSNDIASQLNLSLGETHLLLKVMNDMGVIPIVFYADDVLSQANFTGFGVTGTGLKMFWSATYTD